MRGHALSLLIAWLPTLTCHSNHFPLQSARLGLNRHNLAAFSGLAPSITQHVLLYSRRAITVSPPCVLCIKSAVSFSAEVQVPTKLVDVLFQTQPTIFPSISAARWAVRRKEVCINEEMGKTDTWLNGGENVTIHDRGKSPFRKKKSASNTLIPKVLFEDQHIAVVVKPQGNPMYYTSDEQGRRKRAKGPPDLISSLPNALFEAEPSEGLTPLPRGPAACHRLDRLTGGIVICSKSLEASRGLSVQFSQRKITKRYVAIVIGEICDALTIQTPVDGKHAETFLEPVASTRSLKFGSVTVVNLFPRTGRKHQLRVHLASIGHPIVGDPRHGMLMRTSEDLGGGEWEPISDRNPYLSGSEAYESLLNQNKSDVDPNIAFSGVLQKRGMMLWAAQVCFEHPIPCSDKSSEDGVAHMVVNVSAPTPRKFDEFLRKERCRWDRFRGEGAA